MYDSLNIRFTLPDAQTEYSLGSSIAFQDCDGTTDAKGFIRVQYKGLRIDYNPRYRKGRIRGSLHTFAQGHNLCRFTIDEVSTACTDLANAVGLPPRWLIITGLEAGVNVPFSISPQTFLENLESHKRSLFVAMKPPKRATRPLEYGAFHADYLMKMYDKGEYGKLQGRSLPPFGPPYLLRSEIVYRRTRPLLRLTGLKQLTLADLTQPKVLAAVLTDLHTHWNLIQYKHQIQVTDFKGLSLLDALLLLNASNSFFWEMMRPLLPKDTYRRNRSRSSKLAAHLTNANPYDEAFKRELALVARNTALLSNY